MPRPRKPNNLKVLHGTDQPCRMFDEPDFAPAHSLSPPADLISPDAVTAWKELTSSLTGARVLCEKDLLLLLHFCNLHAHCLKVWRVGGSPLAAELTQLRMMAQEFGLTPASRSKAGQLGEAAETNPFKELTG